MAHAVPRSRIIRSGVYEVDLDKAELRKNGLKLRLRGQPFQVLSILLEHPGEVVTREELSQRLWTNDNTFVDFEHGLNAVVNRLREVLGDSPENPKFIETVPRRGYRWMVPVEGMEDRPIPALPRHRWRWLFWAAALLVVIGVSAGFLKFVLSTPHVSRPTLISTPLTARPGIELDPSFSPDGSQMVFSWYDENEDKTHIYVKLIGTAGPPLQLTNGPDEDDSPAWSPDGRFIAFFRGKSLVVDLGASAHVTLDKAEVRLMPALGGPERKITETFVPNNVPGPFLTWSPDGNSLVISEQDAPKEPAALFVVAIDTGEKRRLTSPPSEASGDTSPAFSPDGRALAFVRMTDVRPELYLLAVSDKLQPVGEARRISLGRLRSLLGHLKGFAPAWSEDGREIVISSWGQGLWRIGVSGSANRSAEPERLPLGDDACCPAISRRGHRLAYSNEIPPHFSIWRGAVPGRVRARDVIAKGSPDRAFISSTRNDLAPQFSPDGKMIAFAS